jgi:hypothetical protein
MSFTMPEVVVQTLIQHGLKNLRNDKAAFYDIFSQYSCAELNEDYGISFVDQIWQWFSTTKIPVIQAWSFNAQKIPCLSIHLANETEDEQKAAMSDYAGDFNGEAETGTAAFTVMLDIGIHANKAGDHVLWLYYIVSYLLFKNKLAFERMGLRLQTYSASDFSKDASKMTENIWTRWIRFKCTTENFWIADPFSNLEDVNFDRKIGLPAASDTATSLDVDIDTVDTTANQGLIASRAGDDDDIEDLNI